MNRSRTFHLIAPVSAEELWQLLATVLSRLLKVYVRITHTYSTHVVVGPDLAPLEGPRELPDGRSRCYSCSELGVSASTDLVTVVKDGHAYRSVVASVISATVSRGMFVLHVWSGAASPSSTEPIDKLFMECNDNALDEVVVLLESVLDVNEVT